jgi:hypothetical protein
MSLISIIVENAIYHNKFLKTAGTIMKTAAVSSVKAKREFSVMDNICSDKRARLS